MAKGTGRFVFISNSIRDIHPGSPLAGQRLEVAELDSEQKRINVFLNEMGDPLTTLTETPVLWGSRVWYVEREYVEGL